MKYSLPEIARRLGVSANAVSIRWKRGYLGRRTEGQNNEVVRRKRAENAGRLNRAETIGVAIRMLGNGTTNEEAIIAEMMRFDAKNGFVKNTGSRAGTPRDRENYLNFLREAKRGLGVDGRKGNVFGANQADEKAMAEERRKAERVAAVPRQRIFEESRVKLPARLYPQETKEEMQPESALEEWIMNAVRYGRDPNDLEQAIGMIMRREGNNPAVERRLRSASERLKSRYLGEAPIAQKAADISLLRRIDSSLGSLNDEAILRNLEAGRNGLSRNGLRQLIKRRRMELAGTLPKF